ncbi:hypothetical protein PanWU01x14_152460 [Parasponia andersonii]|uniref:Uncharacterized protein n=1 Tax=Parasponia andersonii TaxID=3476 RepID=A0A2P5CHC6_PARAD|nr:hypothetical protein PanWU01x14_152460 [Parasponia andersonii]
MKSLHWETSRSAWRATASWRISRSWSRVNGLMSFRGSLGESFGRDDPRQSQLKSQLLSRKSYLPQFLLINR